MNNEGKLYQVSGTKAEGDEFVFRKKGNRK